MNTRRILNLFAIVAVSLNFAPLVQAAPGDLDPTFGTAGKVITSIAGNDVLRGVAVQSDGKILVAGSTTNGSPDDFAVVRYTASGVLDPSFGPGGTGRVTTDVGGSIDYGQKMTLQGDGKILVVGQVFNGSDYDFGLVRYETNGTLDGTFGTGGKVITPIGSGNDSAFAVAVQTDGAIVVAGAYVGPGGNDLAVVRYTSGGVLDPNFGTGGIVKTPVGGDDAALGVVVQSDGKIVIAGYSNTGTDYDVVLVRYTDSGALDAGFGTGGIVTTPIGTGDFGTSVALQTDGKIVVGGASDGDFALVRYTSSGALDTSFNSTGKVTTPIGSGNDNAQGVVVQGDGKIVVAGFAENGGSDDFALARYNADGTLDPDFHGTGKVTTDFGGGDSGVCVALQEDGKILVAGFSNALSGGNNDFAVARYFGVPPPGEVDSVVADTTGLYVIGSAQQPDGKTIIVGTFSTVSGVPRNNIARLNVDGTLDMGFDPNANNRVNAVAVLPDGKIVIAGFFTALQPNGQLFPTGRNYFACLNADGTLNASLDLAANADPGIGGNPGFGYGLAVQADGKLLVWGNFISIQGTTRRGIARLNANGVLDFSFNPNPDGYVFGAAVQGDGKVLLGGLFNTLDPNEAGSPVARRNCARVNANGTVDMSFDPSPSLRVFALREQPDGKVLLCGDFTSLQPNGAAVPTTRNRIARVNADGALDAGFNPDASTEVGTVALQADGKVIIAGGFETLQGAPPRYVARLSANGTPETSFNPNPNGGVLGVTLQDDGKLQLHGAFNQLQPNGASTPTPRLFFARVFNGAATATVSAPDATQVRWQRGGTATELTGVTFEKSLDQGATWAPLGVGVRDGTTADWQRTGLDLGGQKGKLRARGFIASGYFNGCSGLVEQTSDFDFDTVGGSTLTPTLSLVTSATYQGRTMQVDFTLPEPALAGSVKLTFTGVGAPKVFTLVSSFETQGAHRLLFDPDSPMASGHFTSASVLPDGGYTVTLAYRDLTGNAEALSSAISGVAVSSVPPPPGAVAPGFDAQLSAGLSQSSVRGLALQPDGRILIGGFFNSVGGTPRANLARLNVNGTLDETFDGAGAVALNSIHVLPDGKILSRNNSGALSRYLPNGENDPAFQVGVGGQIYGVAVQDDGKIVVGGLFTDISGPPRQNLARLLPDGAIDPSFDPGLDLDSAVICVLVQPDGQILIGGGFTQIGGQQRQNVARLDSDGSVEAAATFIPVTDTSSIYAMALQPDGKIVLGGLFSDVSGEPHRNLARLLPNGAVDSSFAPSFNDQVLSLALQADGKIVAVGTFSDVNGEPRSKIARVDANGVLDNSVTFGAGPDGSPASVAIGVTGEILVGGEFATFDGLPRRGFAALANDSATQTLSVPDATQVRWLRGGAAVEVSRVKFERSLDGGATWSTLGVGARISGGWELTGLNLNNQFGFIRASGLTVGGSFNSSAGRSEQTAPFDFDTFTAGNATPLGDNMIATGNVLSGRHVTISSPAVLVSFGAIFNSAGTQANLALYRMDGDFNRPGTLVAQTGAFTVTGGVKEVAVLGAPVLVEAGTYYLTSIYSDFTHVAAAPTGTNTSGFFRNPFSFTGNLPGFLNEGNLTNQLRAANLYLRLGTLSPAPTLAKPASDSSTRTQVDVDFTLPVQAQPGTLTLTFAGLVTRTYTLAGSLLGAGQHVFSFDPADPIGTSGGAIASANVNDLPEGYYQVTLSYRNLNNEGPGTAVASNFVFDKTTPQLTLPTIYTVEATDADGAVVDFSAQISSSDNVDRDVNLVANPANGARFAIGNTTVNVTVTDDAGNATSGSFTVKVEDKTPPQFVNPTPTGMLTYEATESNFGYGGHVVTYEIVATDLVDASPLIELTAGLPSGAIFPLGTTTVAFKATDDYGNTATGDFQIVITDTTAPILTVPLAVSQEATSPNGAVVNFNVSASDIVDANVAIVATPASGATFALGTTTVTVTATDFSGNQTVMPFDVTVVDTTGPVIQPHADVTVATATDRSGVIVNYDPAVVADAVTGANVTVTYSQDSGTLFAFGQTTVTVTAMDAGGNTSSSEFRVFVRLASPLSDVEFQSGEDAPGRGTNGLPAEAKLASFGVPAIDDAGKVAFNAKWTSDDGKIKGSGLFLDDACLAIVGGDASSIATSATFKSFSDPVISEGSVAVIAGLSSKANPSAVLSNVAVATTLEAVARVGDIAQDRNGDQPIGGAKFKKFKGVAIDGGTVLIFAQLTGGIDAEKATAANDLGLWMKVGPGPLRRVLRENDSVQVQDMPVVTRRIKTLVSFGSGNGSPGAGRGWLAAPYGFTALALVTFDNRSQAVLSSSDNGAIEIFSLSGVAGMTGPAINGATFASYSFPATNDGYNVAFLGSLTVGAGGVTKANARGVFVSDGAGAYTAVARVSGDAPGTSGAKFSLLKDPVLDMQEGVAFPATIKGGAAKGLGMTTLWWRPTMGALTLLAQAGPTTLGVPHDLPAGAQWKSFTSLAVASNRGPLFTGALVPKKGGVTPATANGLWAMDFGGQLRTLFRTGVPDAIVAGKTLKSFTLLKASVGSTGVTRNFNATQKVVWLATFSDKSTAIVTTEVP